MEEAVASNDLAQKRFPFYEIMQNIFQKSITLNSKKGLLKSTSHTSAVQERKIDPTECKELPQKCNLTQRKVFPQMSTKLPWIKKYVGDWPMSEIKNLIEAMVDTKVNELMDSKTLRKDEIYAKLHEKASEKGLARKIEEVSQKYEQLRSKLIHAK